MTMSIQEVIDQLDKTSDINERTTIFQNWLSNITDDNVKMRFVLNSTIPHSIFNVASTIFGGANIQNIDWFKIHKRKDFGLWERQIKK